MIGELKRRNRSRYFVHRALYSRCRFGAAQACAGQYTHRQCHQTDEYDQDPIQFHRVISFLRAGILTDLVHRVRAPTFR